MENVPDDLASDNVAEVDVSDKYIDAVDLERRMWKDRVRLKRIKERTNKTGSQAKRPRRSLTNKTVVNSDNDVDGTEEASGHNINGTHHREEGVLEPNIALGPEENGLVLVVPEFDSNCTHLLPVSGQAMMPEEDLIEMNPSHNNGFEASVEVLQPHGLHENEERDLSTQFQSDSNSLRDLIPIVHLMMTSHGFEHSFLTFLLGG
ncbi:ETHYLENE INSENSITIVE 3-like 3 protein [Raphanus sativus]|nr:ETHYLENE INSENSITIVE 3-like 3 protein [Raphanus sativus]